MSDKKTKIASISALIVTIMLFVVFPVSDIKNVMWGILTYIIALFSLWLILAMGFNLILFVYYELRDLIRGKRYF